MGSYLKIVLFYSKAFWREKGYSGETLSGNKNYEKFPVTFTFDATQYHNEQQVPALVCFITGKPSLWWSDVFHYNN